MSAPHVLVTGASRGIGLAIAERLLHDGASVTLAARSSDSMSEFRARVGVSEARCRMVQIDLSRSQDFDDLVAAVEEPGQRLDGVVHAAGTQLRKPAIEVGEEELIRLLRIHLVVPYLLSTAVARSQIAGGRGGSHVFIASLGSSIAIPNASPYTAAKSGVMGVVRSLAVELAPHGIRANAVAPGYVRTDLTADLLSSSDQRERILGRTPLGRLGQPREVAAAVSFLLGGDSSFVTGEVLRVDGGWLSA
ncbi:SDR family NAD(P)-dependent oxidoreductase [Leucobacter ruminantium]|uniref:SDR family oxidoreductase n=1 Tax=Leucobacter ruminantium TaxID=1289170 RepID=A0A939RXV9_9MICO|nr:SDR family oxidoreductase [Leucobacter ruminantium]MBO1805088.1 SDR family oxidoreductase [Leucobacter ruminantium]